VAVVCVGVVTAIVDVPSGPESVDVVSVFAAGTSSVPVTATGAVDAALGATVPSCCAAAADPVPKGVRSRYNAPQSNRPGGLP
jgi:hypothetical protein